jgi:carbohydrate-binding DOMON domain-containing protein
LATIDEFKIYNYDIYVHNIDRCVVGKICQETTENGDNLLKVFLTKNNEKVDKRKEIILEYYFLGEFKNLNDVYFSLNKIANKSIGKISYEKKQSPYQLIKTINGWEIEKDDISLFVFSNYSNAIKKFNKIKQKTIKCIRLDLLQNYLKINFK